MEIELKIEGHECFESTTHSDTQNINHRQKLKHKHEQDKQNKYKNKRRKKYDRLLCDNPNFTTA